MAYLGSTFAVAEPDPAAVTATTATASFVEGLVHFDGTWFADDGQSHSTLGVATHRPAERCSTLGAR